MPGTWTGASLSTALSVGLYFARNAIGKRPGHKMSGTSLVVILRTSGSSASNILPGTATARLELSLGSSRSVCCAMRAFAPNGTAAKLGGGIRRASVPTERRVSEWEQRHRQQDKGRCGGGGSVGRIAGWHGRAHCRWIHFNGAWIFAKGSMLITFAGVRRCAFPFVVAGPANSLVISGLGTGQLSGRIFSWAFLSRRVRFDEHRT